MNDSVETAKSSKPVVRCRECGYRALLQEAGFTGQVKRFCLKFGSKDSPMEVEPDDGCTFGELGEPTYIRLDYDVQLGSDAAVNGCHWIELELSNGMGYLLRLPLDGCSRFSQPS